MSAWVRPGQLWSGGFGDMAILLYTLKLMDNSPHSWQCLILHGAGRYRDGALDVWHIEDDDGYFRRVA